MTASAERDDDGVRAGRELRQAHAAATSALAFGEGAASVDRDVRHARLGAARVAHRDRVRKKKN